ncbi:MAG: DNA-deoxyinosine glycosylase [Fusobacterium gastrosuis]|uniref:DNA-deoxyinosine glycosylase n=1 Tax=Fusobacterium gastrosuis TaxID=1755100 RepID=UPI002A9A6AFD|nr:DNA-deoxyinosine glycosylase [Fusobacteriaceae bacterium]MDY5795656.1 DNA-deoxyinosine glycosylase [Fusobacterium gastrosuis]
MIEHPIPPTYNKNSKILILGSFPSVKSREYGYFYGHPQNRFWKVVSLIFEDEFPKTKEDKKEFLLKHKIAAWDVIASCDIVGSSDNSITNVKANNLKEIIENSKVEKIFVNGKKAAELYKKYGYVTTNS